MIITALEAFTKSKVKVYLDDEYAFWVYSSDIRRLKWKTGQVLNQDDYEEALQKVVVTNAKKKAAALLAKMDYASGDMRRRLKKAEYPEHAIEEAIRYLSEKHYIDDERYALNYVMYQGQREGKEILRFKLQQKGISAEIAETALETLSQQDEQDNAYKLLKKKYLSWRKSKKKYQDNDMISCHDSENTDQDRDSDIDMPDYPNIQKMKAAAFRKGYSSEVITRAWNVLQQNIREGTLFQNPPL